MNTKHEIEMPTVVSRSEAVVSADMDDDEIVMMNVEKGMYYGMGIVGSYIWKLIERPLSISQLCDTLLARFDVTREVCYQEVSDFLHELHKDGLIDIRNPD